MNKTFFLIVLTASVLAGCTNEKVISGETDSTKAISFGTLVHKATKAIPVTGTSFPDGGNFMVLGYNTGESTLDEVATPTLDFMRQTVTKNGTSYTYSPVKYWPNGAPKISFFAISPADVSTITPTVLNSTGLPTVNYNVPTDVLQQKDLMMAVATDKSNESVSFPFKHALTKIGFTAKLAADYVAQGAYVRITSISLENVAGTAEFEVKNTSGSGDPLWEWVQKGAPTSGTTDYTLDAIKHLANGGYVSSTTASSIINGNSYLMMVPADYSASADARLKVVYDIYYPDGITLTGNTITKLLKDFTTEAGYNWKMGQAVSYNLTITLGGSVGNGHITFGATTVTDWGEPDEIVLPPPANCYIIAPGNSLTIPVDVKGNGDSYTAGLAGISTTQTASSVVKYWETKDGLISIGTLNTTTQKVQVTAGSDEGNAVIAAKDANGNVIWSWHIWVTDEPATETVNGNVWMDRNLGATAVATNADGVNYDVCGGLMYQWGRKDPFVGSNGSTTGNATSATLYNYAGPATAINYQTALTNAGLSSTAPTAVSNSTNLFYLAVTSLTSTYANQLTASIRFPMLFLTSWGGSTATAAAAYTAEGGKSSWGGEYGESKSIFDPCPAGWRVPSGKVTSSTWASPWSSWTTAQGFTTSYYAAVLWNTSGTLYHYPAAGYRSYSDESLSGVGSLGYYWSASPGSSYGCYLYFVSGYVYPSLSLSRAGGFAVRCIQE